MIPVRLPRPSDFPSHLHDERIAARIGMWLGIMFTICFLTGLFSHFHQHPIGGFTLPTRPVWLYRVTQGAHVATGIAAIPLLVLKLWVVIPNFWRRPLFGSLLHQLERASVLVLIAAAGFELITGLLNVAEYYPWTFFFPTVHYAVGWIAVAAIVVHIAVKLPIIRRAFAPESAGAEPEPEPGSGTEPEAERETEPGEGSGLTRRGLLVVAGGAAGVVTVATIGDRIPLFAPVSVAAQRSGRGPQDLPVNRTAVAAGVTAMARSSQWRLTVATPEGSRRFDLAALQALPQHTAELPLACVEGWSRNARWTGIRFADLLAAAGVPDPGDTRVFSLERGLYGVAPVPRELARDPLTLIALRLNGTELDIDHGYPARLIAPGRPGVLQTKWLSRIEML